MLDRRPFWCLIIWLNLCVVIWLVTVQESVMPEASVGPTAEQFQQRQQQLQQQQQQQQEQTNYAGHGKHLLEARRTPTNNNNNNNNSIELNFVAWDSNNNNNNNNVGQTTTISLTSNNNNNNNNYNDNDSYSKYKYQIHSKASREVRRLNRHSNKTNLVIEYNNNSNNNNNNKNKQQQQHYSSTSTTTTTTRKTPYINLYENVITPAPAPATATTPHGAPAPAPAPAAPLTPLRAAFDDDDDDDDDVDVDVDLGVDDDEQQLIDLHDFAYLMAQPACDAHTAALILVHTAPHNRAKRQLIRQTWGSEDVLAQPGPLRLLFLLGAVEPNHTLQGQLIDENAIHADMVQGSFYDDYRNMTYKHVMALKWFHYNCAQAQLLIKVDDDVFVNTPFLRKYLSATPTEQLDASASSSSSGLNSTKANLLRLLFQPERADRTQAPGRTRDLLFCQQFLGARVKRSYRSKWRVSFNEYRERFYPPYCPGYAIVYSADVVAKLYRAAQRANYFWIDDVMITGVLAQRTNTSITQMEPYVLFSGACARLLAAPTDFEAMEFLFSWHSILPAQVRALWALYEASSSSSRQAATNATNATSSAADAQSPSLTHPPHAYARTQPQTQTQSQTQFTAR